MLLGVGYSQFRAGFSAAGESVFPPGARLSLLPNEHFSSWSGNALTDWVDLGPIFARPSSSAPSIDSEFTAYAAVYDLTSAPSGVGFTIAKSAQAINNQLAHRFQLDYQYTNAQSASALGVQIYEANGDGNTYFWNPTSASWSTAAYTIPLPPSTARTRYACDVVPQPASAVATTMGTKTVTVSVLAYSDGTATTMVAYTLYRIGLYEKFNLAIEKEAGGERTLWLPIRDAPNASSMSRAGGGAPILEIADASRASYKVLSASQPIFPYHPALSHRALAVNSNSWTNLLQGSNDFGTDWAVANCSRTPNAVISPVVGETVPSAVLLTAFSDPAVCAQATGSIATNRTYVGGVWVKKIFADNISTTIELALFSTTGERAYSYTVKQADGWKLLAIPATTFGAGDLSNVVFRIRFHATGGSIAVASSYLYDVTGRPSVLYPPVCQTPVGSTGAVAATTCNAITASPGVNVLHPYLQRTLASVVRGATDLVIVPLYDGPDQPNGVIFDVAQSASANRLVLRVNAGALELRRWDSAGHSWVSSLNLSTSPSPSAGTMTWLRDTEILVRAIWDDNSTQLSAGHGNAPSGTKPGSWAPSDANVSTITIGNDLADANAFDGLISDVEVLQLGAPIS